MAIIIIFNYKKGTIIRLLRTTCRFQKMLGMSFADEEILISQERLCSIQLGDAC
jgi:hypothetical protein